MSTLLLTLGLAFVAIISAVSFLAISWLVKGKSSLKAGACGKDPNKLRDESECGETTTNCHLCKRPDDDKCKPLDKDDT